MPALTTERSTTPATGWQAELVEAMRLSRAAESELPLSAVERQQVADARARFPLLIPPGYVKLIDWSDAGDPLRRLLMPSAVEASSAGRMDTSGEADAVVVQGIQHMYEQTAALILTQACAGHCRYCFRRRLMSKDVFQKETIEDLQSALDYLRRHDEIDNVLLSGGDPLICNTRRLERLFEALSDIEHIRAVRISTKLPAFLPSRFTADARLMDLLRRSADRLAVMVQCHYDHPRELCAESEAALAAIRDARCMLVSQVAMMRGINDDADVMFDLVRRLHGHGVVPGYIFHPRPVKHATHFQLSIVEALDVIEAVRRRCSGPLKRFRYVMVQEDGKIELVGVVREGGRLRLVMRWHQVRRGLDRPPIELTPITPRTVWIAGETSGALVDDQALATV